MGSVLDRGAGVLAVELAMHTERNNACQSEAELVDDTSDQLRQARREERERQVINRNKEILDRQAEALVAEQAELGRYVSVSLDI